MSYFIYVLSDPLFQSSDEPINEPMTFFLPALLLSNYENCKKSPTKDSIFFYSYVEHLLFNDEAQFSDREGSKFNENCEKLRKLFKRLRDYELNGFYEFLKESSAMNMFCSLLKLAVQRILYVLFKELGESDNAVIENSHFIDAREGVENKFIQDDPIIVMVFLQLLRKNCILYCDPNSNFKSKTFSLNENYSTLSLYMDKDKEFQFMHLKKPSPASETFYKKLKIPNDGSTFPLGFLENEEKKEEEFEMAEMQAEKPAKLTYETALDEFLTRFLEKLENNIPEKGSEKKAKEKFSDQIYTFINEKEKNFKEKEEFNQWKDACQKFHKKLLDLELSNPEEVKKFKKKILNMKK